MKVAFLTNIVSPYRRGVFERLARTPGWDFRVIINARTEHDRQWEVDTSGLPVQTTRTWSLKRRVVTLTPVRFEQVNEFHVPIGLWGDLRRFRPDVIISHELGPRTLVAATYARAHRIPLAVWAYQSRVSGTQGGAFKRQLRSQLLRSADVAIGMGAQAREVLRKWGAEDSRIVDAPNSADHVGLSEQLNSPLLAEHVRAIRGRFDGRRLAIVVGRLIPLKGIPEVIAAWRSLPAQTRRQWQLVFIGDGPMRSLVEAAGMDGVSCAGPARTQDMAAWYRAADLHIFPTLGDVWGLVVNEASQCGTPTLCSVHAGCSDELIQDGKTGLLFDPVKPLDASRALQAALAHPNLPGLGEAAVDAAAPFTLDRLADGFREGVSRALLMR